MATVRLRDGEVSLYTRGDSKNYYAGYRLRGGGRLQESLKTKNKAVAKERALERYDDIKAREKYGLTQNTVSFAEAADAWLLHLTKEVAGGARKPRTVIDYTPAVEHYLKPYFAGRDVDDIKSADMEQYRTWRNEYWLSGPGAKIRTITYIRTGVEVTRPTNEKYRRYPAPRTINGENVILRCILKHAVAQGWMLANQVPKVAQAKLTTSDSRKRAYPHFERWEYHKLKRFMTLWVNSNEQSEGERWRREAIQDFILILLNSGLREHELFKKDERTHERRGLRWRDVVWFTSKGNVETVELHVDGKTGERTVICQRPVRVILERRRKLRAQNTKIQISLWRCPTAHSPPATTLDSESY